MADVMSREKRSALMSRIRGRDTRIELDLFRALRRAGLRFRKHVRVLPGCTPDAVFAVSRVALFVDGDFWHGWRFPRWQAKLQPFWREKIASNRRRDARNHRALRRRGWRVLRLWEHEVERDLAGAVERMRALIESGANPCRAPARRRTLE